MTRCRHHDGLPARPLRTGHHRQHFDQRRKHGNLFGKACNTHITDNCWILSSLPAGIRPDSRQAENRAAVALLSRERWRQAEVYTQDVLDIKPEADLKYAPFAGEMTFCNHLTHLAFYNVFLLTAIQRQGPPSQMDTLMKSWAEPRNASKELAGGILATNIRKSAERDAATHAI